MFEVGRTYTAYRQGMTITPREVRVRVVWLENGHVHYQVEGDTTVEQTPLERFEEITNPKFTGGSHGRSHR